MAVGAFQAILDSTTEAPAGPTTAHLIEMPIVDSAARNAATVIAVVSVWRRPQHFVRMLDALAAQWPEPPQQIWVTAFASAHELEFRGALDAWNIASAARSGSGNGTRGPRAYFFTGDKNLKYFARFQLALGATTSHVWIMDDDVIPEPWHLALLLHTAHTSAYGQPGVVLGVKGHTLDWPWPTPAKLLQYWGPGTRQAWMQRVDVVGGSWFMRAADVPLLWREPLYTRETGEDYQLCYAVTKYRAPHGACYVMPADGGATAGARGFSADYDDMSSQGDSTWPRPGDDGVNRIQLRVELAAHLWFARGHMGVAMATRTPPRPLVLVRSLADLQWARTLLSVVSIACLPSPNGRVTLATLRETFGTEGVDPWHLRCAADDSPESVALLLRSQNASVVLRM